MTKRLELMLLIVLVAGLMPGAPAPAAALDLVATSDEIERLLQAGLFSRAEPLVRQCVAAAPEDIHFLSNLEVVLNGLGRVEEAGRVREEHLDLWRRLYRDNWLARGAPVAESSWARVMLNDGDWRALAAEYYEPVEDPLDRSIRAYFKVIVLPTHVERGAAGVEDRVPVRLFKMETSGPGGRYTLNEIIGGVRFDVLSYGLDLPAIRQVVADALQAVATGQRRKRRR